MGHTYDLRSTINIQFFSDLSGNSRALKSKKAQTKWENITYVQYFRGLRYSRLYLWMNRNIFNFILSFLSFLHPHYLPQLQFSPPPLREYTAPQSVREYNSVRALRPRPLKRPIWRRHTPLFPSLSTNQRASGDASVITPATINFLFLSFILNIHFTSLTICVAPTSPFFEIQLCANLQE